MKFTTALTFDGNCREAFETYARIFGGAIRAMIRNADMPADHTNPWAAERPDKIIHAWLDVGDQSLMGNDVPPQWLKPVSGFAVCVRVEVVEEARRIFEALGEGGAITMPFGETFWSPGFGMTTDRFGTPWMIDTERRAETPADAIGGKE